MSTKVIEFLSAMLVTAFRSVEQEQVLYNRLNVMESRLQWLINICFIQRPTVRFFNRNSAKTQFMSFQNGITNEFIIQ